MIILRKTNVGNQDKKFSNEENFVKQYLLQEKIDIQNTPWINGHEFAGETLHFERNPSSDNLADIKIKITPYACLLQNPQSTVVSGRITQDEMFPEILWFQMTQNASCKFKNMRLAFIDSTDKVSTKYISRFLILNSLHGIDFVPYNKNLLTTNSYRFMDACACPYNFGPTRSILIPHKILPYLNSLYN